MSLAPGEWAVGRVCRWTLPLRRLSWPVIALRLQEVGGRLCACDAALGAEQNPPTLHLGPDVECRLVTSPEERRNRRDYWPTGHTNGKFESGSFHAPYVLDRYWTGKPRANGFPEARSIGWSRHETPMR